VAGLIKQLDSSSVRHALGVLFPIRTRGSKPPFFCIHPGGGVSWCYASLARYVPADYPLYGLQARGLDGMGELASSIRDMAADYIEQMRAVQGSGPYHLLGWSFGGIVAHEIAVQLQASGDEVAALIIMDGFPMRRDASAQGSERPAAATQDVALPDMKDEVRRQYGVSSGVISDEDIMIAVRVFQNNIKITRSHECQEFGGDLLLIVSGKGRRGSASAATLWKPYASGKISEISIPCMHHELIQPDMLAQVWTAISTWLKLES
jgi:thioesterase domain-containing protein